MSEIRIKYRIHVILLLLVSFASGQGRESRTDYRFNKAMNEPGAIFWSDSPLREAFVGLGQTRKISIWIDRRCDPTQKVTLISQEPLRECLWQLNQRRDELDIAWSSNVIYIGPSGAADRWATVHARHVEMLKKLSPAQRQKWTTRRPWRWPHLTNPQDLLVEIENELGSSIAGRDRVLHDLWPARDYSRLTLLLRLELLLSGFNQTFVFDRDGKPTIREMPKAPRITNTLPSKAGLQQKVNEVLKVQPSAKLDGRELTGSWRIQEMARRQLREPKQKRSLQRNLLRYTLLAKDQPLGPFITQLSEQLSLECEFSDAAKRDFNRMVSFQVDEASLEQLIATILKDTSLAFTLEGEKLFIQSKE